MTGHATEYRPACSDKEFRQILTLQRANQPDALDAEEILQEGFVTLTHTLALLHMMSERCPQLIAVEKDCVLGYALCLHPGLAGEIPDLEPMFRTIRECFGHSEDYRVMGQVCIDRRHRRKGHFRMLYEELRRQCAPFPLITEVAMANTRSLEAHYAIGFTRLALRGAPGQQWEVLIWK